MQIANPMYDAVFKHLMEDKKIAKLFLSALTGLDIRSLQPLPQELIVDIGDNPQLPLQQQTQLSLLTIQLSAQQQQLQ